MLVYVAGDQKGVPQKYLPSEQQHCSKQLYSEELMCYIISNYLSCP
jgi:hypothetical protein